MRHNQFNSEEYFKIKEGATQQVLIVHDTDSIEDETTRFSNAPLHNHTSIFSQSQTQMRGMPKMIITPIKGGDEGYDRRRSCGNAEIGVVLSDAGHQQAGTMHHMDDVTAEVDEREEYSNDFDDGGDTTSRGACKLSDLARDVSDIKRLAPGDSETKVKEQADRESNSGKDA